MMKVGVIGLGEMGRNHVRIYSQLGCELLGVADTNIERAKEIGKKYGVKYYADYHDLLPNVEAVSIVVPTTLHHAVAMDCSREGVHYLVEKPIASNLYDAEEMIEAAESNRVSIAVGHIERFNPAVIKLKQIVDDGILGKLLIISTRRVGPFVPRVRDVGVVIDSATHDIGVIKYLLGKDPISVFSRSASLKHSKEDHAIIVLNFVETTACIEVNWFTPHKVRTLVATGSKGIAYLDYIDQSIRVFNSHDEVDLGIVEVRRAEPLKLELDDFLKSVAERRKPAVTGEEGWSILKIALESCKNCYLEFPPLSIDISKMLKKLDLF
jgi:UDP-N-acetylglucosamine 3-dehydrogenase